MESPDKSARQASSSGVSFGPQSAAVWAAKISVAVSTLLLVIKFIAYWRTGSQAILSDALESIVNVAASFVALFVLRFVAAPADENHPYGHGKLEFFSSAFEGGLVAFAALAIGYTAIRSLILGSQLQQLDLGIALMLGTALANLVLGIFLGRVARSVNSEALRASSVHVLSDVWSTGYVVVGLLVVAGTGWVWVDSLVALGAAGHLSWAAWKVIRKSVAGLMDEMEPESIQEIAQAFTKTRRPGLIDLHRVKVIRSGNFHHIDGHVVIPEFWSIHQAHEAMNQFEKEVLQAYRYDGEVALHMDPCGRRFCSRCDLPDCQVRQRPQSLTSRFDYRHLIAGPMKDPE